MNYILEYPTNLNEINIFNDNIDVCLQLEDGRKYVFVVATPDNLKEMMKKDQVPYVKPGLPCLFVEELTDKNIRQLIEELLNDDDIFLRIYGSDFFEEI